MKKNKPEKVRKDAKRVRVLDVDPFTVEIYESEDKGFSGNRVVVTIANNAVRYEFTPAAEAYWFILQAGDDTDALKAFLSILTLTAEKLSTDNKFLADMTKIIDKSIKQKIKEGKVAAKAVTEDDETVSQDFMKGVAEEIDKIETGKAKRKNRKK